MSEDLGERHNILIPQPIWRGLELVSKLNGTSISEEVRRGAMVQLSRYGLSVVDGELTVNPLLWPAEIQEIHGGGIQNGGRNPPGRRIHAGGDSGTPAESTGEGRLAIPKTGAAGRNAARRRAQYPQD